MNARELLANTLSAGMPLPLYRVFRREELNFTLPNFADANTRQDAAQKLEAASHDSYVRQIQVPSPFSTSFVDHSFQCSLSTC
jgi:hypothetical protein